LALLVSVLLTGCAATGQRFRVADFGAVGDGKTDDRAAIQRAIDAAVKAGPGSTVLFEKGRVYRLAQHAPAYGMLLLNGADGVSLDGNGATLLCHPANRILAVYASKRVAVRNFILDYAPLPFTQGRMQTVEPEAGFVEFAVSPGYQAPVLGGETIYPNFKSSDCVFVRADGTFTRSWLRLREITQPREGTFKARFHGAPKHVSTQLRRTKAGDFIAVKMRVPKGEVLRTPDGRFIATGVANINVAFSRDFEALMDDSINVKISSERVKQVRGRRVLVSHGDILYNVRGVSFRSCAATIEDGRTLEQVIRHHGCANVDTTGVAVE
jgi:hypothetical protein